MPTVDTNASLLNTKISLTVIGIANIIATVTRSHKSTDRDHAGLANGTAVPQDNLPKYFGKAGYAGESPSNTKKQGGGKGNW